MNARFLATLGVLAAVSAGCTSSTDSSSGAGGAATASPGTSAPAQARSGSTSAQAAPSPSSSPSPSPTPPPAPEERRCYRLSLPQVVKASSSREPVPCRERHTTQTIHVGRLRHTGDGAVNLGSKKLVEQLSTVCPRRLAGYLGGDRSTRQLSRFRVVWFTPTAAQVAAGADWFRCDAIALAGRERLAALPSPRRLEGLLERGGALDDWGLCGTAAPGAAGFDRVICSHRHSWQAVATIHLRGGKRYPGQRQVRTGGDERCKDLVRGLAPSSLRFRYGWEWPSREQWQRGQHYGYCWAPD